VEHVDVLIVGAGLSGIGAARHLQQKCPWASFMILEGRDDLGGTWDLFRYPGVRSDSDMHTLGYSFRPWDGADSIASGDDILRYLRDTATETGVDRHIRYRHRVERADWSSDLGCWRITARRTDSDDLVELTCGFLFSCSGYYRYDRGYLPDFPGIEQFSGALIHPQDWPEDLDVAGKRIVVIGSGATAITLVPSLARTAAHVTMLQRSPSYVVSMPRRSPLVRVARRVLPERAGAWLLRWLYALGTQALYRVSRRRPDRVRRVLLRRVAAELPPGYDVATHFTPHYDPWDQRLCAVTDGDLFDAIRIGRASVVTDHIETFTPDGLRLRSGEELHADVVVTATGLDLLFLGGVAMTVDGEEVDLPGRLSYKGMMLEGVPNFAMAIGYTNASWTLKADLTSDAVCRLLNRLRAKGLRRAVPVNRDTPSTGEPLLGLTSGYVERAADRFPCQGAAAPWRVEQSYVRDVRAMRLSPLEDGVLELADPRPLGPPVEPAAAS